MKPDVELSEVSDVQGKLNTKAQTELYAYTCIYIMYKHYSTLYKVYPWTSIFPKAMITDENLVIVEEFEKYIIRKVTKYVVFRFTFLDLLSVDNTNDQNKELTVKNFLVNYGIMKSYKGKMSSLYSDIKTFINQTVK